MDTPDPFTPIDPTANFLEDRKTLRTVDLDRLLHVRPTTLAQIRSKSATSPLAPIKTLYPAHSRSSAAEQTVIQALAHLRKQSLPLFSLLAFQVATGCRISEALRIRPYDITPSGLVILKSSKNSQDRVLHGGEAMPFLKHCKAHGLFPWQEYTRFTIYKLYRRLGISFQFGTNGKNSVTHAPRHLIALDISGTEQDTAKTQRFLGHKSNLSTQAYTGKIKK